MRVAYDVMCTVHFFRGIPPFTEKLLKLLLINQFKTHYKCLKFSFNVNVANGVVFDVANDVFPIWWMDVHLFRFNHLESL